MTLTDAISETLMRTVKDCAIQVLKQPEDYRLRAQIMWAGSLSHNDLTQCGGEKDFVTHKIEHELSALFGVTHGAGLAALWPSWARYVMPRHVNRFVQFAVNVMGVHCDYTDLEATALKGIEAIEDFYRTIGMPTNIPQLLGRPVTDDEINEMLNKCTHNGKLSFGSIEKIDADAMTTIYNMANG